MKRILVTAAMSAMVTLAATPAHAALIRITPTGFTPAEYEAAGFPTDPAIIGGDGFRLTYWGGGNDTLVNPVMLILATPTGTTAPVLSVTNSAGFTSVVPDLGDTQTRYGGTWNTTTGYAGTFSSSNSGSVYDAIGFNPKGNASENYANWNGATGISSWNLFVYAITFNPQMAQGDYVEFATSLPVGSYVVGYGCESLNTAGTKCGGSGTTESTPFTFAGNVTSVPEPASITLMLSGVGLAFARARRRA